MSRNNSIYNTIYTKNIKLEKLKFSALHFQKPSAIPKTKFGFTLGQKRKEEKVGRISFEKEKGKSRLKNRNLVTRKFFLEGLRLFKQMKQNTR